MSSHRWPVGPGCYSNGQNGRKLSSEDLLVNLKDEMMTKGEPNSKERLTRTWLKPLYSRVKSMIRLKEAG